MIAECTPNAGNYNLLDYRILSAFLRRHRKESGGLLMNVFTAALRAGDLALFVFCKGKDDASPSRETGRNTGSETAIGGGRVAINGGEKSPVQSTPEPVQSH
jgi:hypothetical protein